MINIVSWWGWLPLVAAFVLWIAYASYRRGYDDGVEAVVYEEEPRRYSAHEDTPLWEASVKKSDGSTRVIQSKYVQSKVNPGYSPREESKFTRNVAVPKGVKVDKDVDAVTNVLDDWYTQSSASVAREFDFAPSSSKSNHSSSWSDSHNHSSSHSYSDSSSSSSSGDSGGGGGGD